MNKKEYDENGYIHVPIRLIQNSGLKGNALLVYCLIYGFSQDGVSVCKGGSQYISWALNISREAVRLILKNLVETKYVIEIENDIRGVKFYDYQTNLDTYQKFCSPSKNKQDSIQKNCKTSKKFGDAPKNLEHGINIDNNIYSNIDNNSIIPFSHNALSSDNDAQNENKVDFTRLKDFFNSQMDEHNCIIPRINTISSSRRKAFVTARIREYGKDAVMKVIMKASVSNFLNGGSDSGFVANFDWIFRPNNFPKILEGNYDNRDQNNNSASDRARQERFREYEGVIEQLKQEQRDEWDREDRQD